MYLKSKLYSTTLSPSLIHKAPPCLNVCCCNKGSRTGSNSSPTFSNKTCNKICLYINLLIILLLTA